MFPCLTYKFTCGFSILRQLVQHIGASCVPASVRHHQMATFPPLIKDMGGMFAMKDRISFGYLNFIADTTGQLLLVPATRPLYGVSDEVEVAE